MCSLPLSEWKPWMVKGSASIKWPSTGNRKVIGGGWCLQMRTIRITLCLTLVAKQNQAMNTAMHKIQPNFPAASLPECGGGRETPRWEALSTVSSESLLGARGELKIQHNGEQYSLRRTRLGKLILTK